ncbi:hypothetical protein, partial [Burkholderia pseudomallei]
AALSYAIQQILHRRGFLDAEGNQVPSRLLAKLPRGGADSHAVAALLAAEAGSAGGEGDEETAAARGAG